MVNKASERVAPVVNLAGKLTPKSVAGLIDRVNPARQVQARDSRWPSAVRRAFRKLTGPLHRVGGIAALSGFRDDVALEPYQEETAPLVLGDWRAAGPVLVLFLVFISLFGAAMFAGLRSPVDGTGDGAAFLAPVAERARPGDAVSEEVVVAEVIETPSDATALAEEAPEDTPAVTQTVLEAFAPAPVPERIDVARLALETTQAAEISPEASAEPLDDLPPPLLRRAPGEEGLTLAELDNLAKLDALAAEEATGGIPTPFAANVGVSSAPVEAPPAYDPPHLALALAGDVTLQPRELDAKVARGDTLMDLLRAQGVRRDEAHQAIEALGGIYNPNRLRAGETVSLTLARPNMTLFELAALEGKEPEARLMALSLRAEIDRDVGAKRGPGGAFVSDERRIPLERRPIYAGGEIESSLYVDGLAAGMTDAAIIELMNIFIYDVDFQREIRPEDRFRSFFTVVYDDRGQSHGLGELLYGELTLRGKDKGFYRFKTPDDGRIGYYDADGRSAKKFLMKTPIDGARISSGFSSRRKHPVLGYTRAHKGTDFAAPRGTPIKAAGDGVIEIATKSRSFGNYIKIRHADGWHTLYAHMTKFARGMRKGARVQQGQIIGTVGSTGLASGPHLHYEVHRNGKATNPMKIKVATGRNLSGANLDAFKAERNRIDSLMDETNKRQSEERTAELAPGAGAPLALMPGDVQ